MRIISVMFTQIESAEVQIVRGAHCPLALRGNPGVFALLRVPQWSQRSVAFAERRFAVGPQANTWNMRGVPLIVLEQTRR